MKHDLDLLLRDLYYDEPRLIETGDKWQLWEGDLDFGGAPQRQRILHLLSRPSSTHIQHARERIRSLRSADPHLVLLADARITNTAVEAIRDAFPSAQVSTIASRQRKAILRESSPQKLEAPEYYIAPTVKLGSSGFEPSTGIQVLLDWIRGESGRFPNPRSRVGVLLAPAGTGKTALALQLAKALLATPSIGAGLSTEPLPLLVERGSWPSGLHDSLSDLSEVFGNALLAQYRYRPYPDRFERSLCYGAMCLIFDGIDELCSLLPDAFKAEEIIGDLIGTLSEIEGPRLILTCRESFWYDNVPPATQQSVTILQLLPFDNGQREAFLSKRFPGENDKPKRDRTRGLLDSLERKTGSMRSVPSLKTDQLAYRMAYLPWVVHLAAKAVEEGRRNAAYEANSEVQSPIHDPLGDILLEFCNREVVRAKQPLNPEQQLALLSELAAESDDLFPKADIDTYFEMAAEKYRLQISNVEIMRDHGLLALYQNERASFQYPEVHDYLRARAVVAALNDDKAFVRPDRVLKLCAGQPGRLLDFVSQLVRVRFDIHEFIRRMQDLRVKHVDAESRSGLLHIFFRVVRDFGLSSQDVTASVCEYLGNKSDMLVLDALWSGMFTNIDLRGVTFENSTFSNFEFDHCRFNDGTRFHACKFRGPARLNESNSGLGSVQIDERCELDQSSRDAFRRHDHRKVRPAITKADILNVVNQILHYFTIGQTGFKTRKEEDARRVARNKSSFGLNVLDTLTAKGVLARFDSGTLKMMKVSDTKSVGNFVNQSQLSGSVSRAIDGLVGELATSKPK